MIDANVAARLGRLIRDSVTPVGEVRPTDPGLQPGQRFTARILAERPDGTFQAQVGQNQLTIALPRSAQRGEVLDLLVERVEGAAIHAKALPPGEPDAGGKTNLSTTARLIARLLDSPQGEPLRRAIPLVQTPRQGDLPASLAQGLQHAVTLSGMFYESHQARWVEGRLGTEQLRQEPQNHPAPGAHLPDLALTEGHANLVQQQLETLAARQFVWQGEAWPGQALHWTLTPPAEEAQHAEEDVEGNWAPERTWTTRLSLTLPRLGTVEARLALSAKGVAVRLLTDSRAAGASLALAQRELADRLATMAVPLQGFIVGDSRVDHE